MNDESPIQPALPAVVPSAVGPAISYSNIRAVTSRAQSAADQIQKKVKSSLNKQLQAAGSVGAKLETKIRQRLGEQLDGPERLYNDLGNLVKNNLAAGMAHAVVTLESLDGALASNTMESVSPIPAGEDPSTLPLPASERGFVQTAGVPLRAGGLASRLRAAASGVAGGSPLPGPHTCDNPPDAAIEAARRAAANYEHDILGEPNDFPLTIWFLDPSCCVGYRRDLLPNDPFFKCVTFIYGGGFSDASLSDVATIIVNTLKSFGVPLATSNCSASCPSTPPVDCTKNPSDPSCPPDCKANPSDPRCPPPTDHCPPPCIDVTCPPPQINLPPCPDLSLPECINIDLCDWDKFCEKIKECLVKAKEDCALDNETAYVFKDCDGTFGEGVSQSLGSLDGGALSTRDMEDAASKSLAAIAALDATKFPSLSLF